MDGDNINPDQVLLLNPLLVIILVPLFSWVIYPLAGSNFKVAALNDRRSAGNFVHVK